MNLRNEVWYGIAIVFGLVGAYKLWLGGDFVGGDAYNFIINSTKATAYFVLSLIFVVIGAKAQIIDALDARTPKDIIAPNHTVDQ